VRQQAKRGRKKKISVKNLKRNLLKGCSINVIRFQDNEGTEESQQKANVRRARTLQGGRGRAENDLEQFQTISKNNRKDRGKQE